MVIRCIHPFSLREGEELKAPRHASAVVTRNGNLPYIMALFLTLATLLLQLPSKYKYYLAGVMNIIPLLPLNLTFNLYTQSIYINKRLQCLIQIRLYYYIRRVILAINLLNLKEFLTLIGLLKCYNINYKALLLYSTKLN